MTPTTRREVLAALLALAGAAATRPARASGSAWVVGITAEFGMEGSHSAQSIARGIELALDEANRAGGLPGGRRLVLRVLDDRGVPARGADNFRDFAADPDVLAVFCGRFSPVAMELAPIAGQLGLPLLDVWAAADGVTRQPEPNYTFRLSLTDTWAIEVLLDHARSRRLDRLVALLPNTAWGRSNEAALATYLRRHPRPLCDVKWYHWGEADFAARLEAAREGGAKALLMVANEPEGAAIVRQMGERPAGGRLPVLAHWGILGGRFHARVKDVIDRVDLAIVTTHVFDAAARAPTRALSRAYRERYGEDPSLVPGSVGLAHAYDMTHLLVLALRRAGRGDRAALRAALGQVGPHEGVVRRYERPFSPASHEALDRGVLRMARFAPDGRLASLERR